MSAQQPPPVMPAQQQPQQQAARYNPLLDVTKTFVLITNVHNGMAKSIVKHYLLQENHNVVVLTPNKAAYDKMTHFKKEEAVMAGTSLFLVYQLQAEVDDHRMKWTAAVINASVAKFDLIITVPRMVIGERNLTVAMADQIAHPLNIFKKFSALLLKASNPKFVVVSPSITNGEALLRRQTVSYRAMQAGMHEIIEQFHEEYPTMTIFSIAPRNHTSLLSVNADVNTTLPESDRDTVYLLAESIKNTSREKHGGKWVNAKWVWVV